MLRQLLSQEIAKMSCGCNMSIETAEFLLDQATHPALKDMLQHALTETKKSLADFEKSLDILGGSKDVGSNALGDICEEAREAALNIEDHKARDLTILYKYLNITHYAKAGFKYYETVANAAGEKEIVEMFIDTSEISEQNDAMQELMEMLAGEVDS